MRGCSSEKDYILYQMSQLLELQLSEFRMQDSYLRIFVFKLDCNHKLHITEYLSMSTMSYPDIELRRN